MMASIDQQEGNAVPFYLMAPGRFPDEKTTTAVLEPDNQQGSFAPLIFSAIFAVAGGGMLAFLVKVGFDH